MLRLHVLWFLKYFYHIFNVSYSRLFDVNVLINTIKEFLQNFKIIKKYSYNLMNLVMLQITKIFRISNIVNSKKKETEKNYSANSWNSFLLYY